MNCFVPYRSRLEWHKSPFGAVKAGAEITFRVVMPRHMRCRGLRLCWGDYDGAWERGEPFFWERMEGEHEEWWQLRLTVREPGLYRYRFSYDSDGGGGLIGNEGQGVGAVGEAAWWQLTVYEADFALPSWVPGGVLYQIFPDRFHASGQKARHAVPADRKLRSDWGGEPQWQPDERGAITRYDFFGGDLAGIGQKLDYLVSLGVTCLYLNPIFEAHSNHRYDTADYLKIDPLLGDENDFSALCEAAHERGLRVILDGVFSHTGADSVYFNRAGRYPGPGAFQSEESPYRDWYHFRHWPRDYACWWGIDILPELEEAHPQVLEFFTGEEGVVRRWLRAGADGWRLDVADELPNDFLDRLYAAALAEKPEAYLLGEVWEDASRKWSQGARRRFLLGRQMHSVMNYPLAKAILRFALRREAAQLAELVLDQLEHYPPCAVAGLMNHIGTHDTARALTRLAGEGETPDAAGPSKDRQKWAGLRIPRALEAAAEDRLKLCAALQFTLPGNPCVYYGDEAGMQGHMDPFNRGCFPWGNENQALLAWYRALGELRREHAAFRGISFELISAALGCVAYLRENILVIANANPHGIDYHLPESVASAELRQLLGGGSSNGSTVYVPAESAVIYEKL
ncbi:MAG: glycoside hydrolase family 13 protein [Oscillospiraceae bacterium]|nr:glycoside hydrolase family 13 protein [Oscillospiraceae bacterium]